MKRPLISRAILVLVAFCMCLVFYHVLSEASEVKAEDSQHIDLVGQVEINPFARCGAVAVRGNYAYVAAADHGLRVVDVSDPAHPSEVGFDNTLRAIGVQVAGSYAYVTDGYGGLYCVNVSDAAHPTQAGEYHSMATMNGVAVDTSGLAYIAYSYYPGSVTYGDHGLRVLNVSQPLSVTEVGFCEMPERGDSVVVKGSFAYVATERGLRVVDVANAAQPKLAGFCATPHGGSAIAVARGYAYLVNRESGLRIIDVSDPVRPWEVGSYEATWPARTVEVAGDYAYVAADDGGMRVIDVSDREHPTEAGHYDNMQWGAMDVAVADGYCYVAAWYEGLLVLRYTGMTDATPPDILMVNELPEDISISRNLCPGSIVLELSVVARDLESKLDWLRLYYDVNGSTQPYVELDSDGEMAEVFFCSLGPFPDPGTVHFHFRARDMAGNESRVPPVGTDPYGLSVEDCPGCVSQVVDFSPRTDGFRFLNFSTRLFPGYCSGMAASAIDYYEYGVPIPVEYNRWAGPGNDPHTPLSCYIARRHMVINRYAAPYILRQLVDCSQAPRNKNEYQKVLDRITGGRTALVALGYWDGHAVTAYACTECSDGRVALFVYDSNNVNELQGAYPGVINGRLTLDGLTVDSTSTGGHEDIFAPFDGIPSTRLPTLPDLSSCTSSDVDRAITLVATADHTVDPMSMVESPLAAGEVSPAYPFWHDTTTSSSVFAIWTSGTSRLRVFRADGSLFSDTGAGASPLVAHIPAAQSGGVWSYQITHLGPSGANIRGTAKTSHISLVGYPRFDSFLPVIFKPSVR